MCFGCKPAAPPLPFVPRTYGEKVAVWVNETFEKNREALGYASDSHSVPSFLVTNDLVAKYFGLMQLAMANKANGCLKGMDEAMGNLIRSYKEPRTESCCSFWHSVEFEKWKGIQELIEKQKELGNDDVVALLTI